jgi:hypothetical protein
MFRRKCMARAKFKILLECFGPGIIFKADNDNRFPRPVLCGVRGLACIVLLEAFLEVTADAGVAFLRIGKALEKIDVLHKVCPPSPRLQRATLRSPAMRGEGESDMARLLLHAERVFPKALRGPS